jgi:hypothetical protein
VTGTLALGEIPPALAPPGGHAFCDAVFHSPRRSQAVTSAHAITTSKAGYQHVLVTAPEVVGRLGRRRVDDDLPDRVADERGRAEDEDGRYSGDEVRAGFGVELAVFDCGRRARDASAVLTNSAKNGGTSRHGGDAERPENQELSDSATGGDTRRHGRERTSSSRYAETRTLRAQRLDMSLGEEDHPQVCGNLGEVGAMKKRLCVLCGAGVVGLGILAPSASAEVPKSCWGVVTSQRASTLHDVGEHSSSFAGEPRLGLGNVARALSDLTGGSHVSDLGAFLATADGIDATHCP